MCLTLGVAALLSHSLNFAAACWTRGVWWLTHTTTLICASNLCPLVHVDWGIFGQLATRATGHLGFGVFAAKQCLWHGGSLLQGRVAL